MKISIITPMYNSGAYIDRMITSLNNLTYPKDEIEFIFIDNGSVDDSVQIVESNNYFCQVMPDATISKMRNYGASIAKGEILGFVDSDCLVDKDWAKTAENLLLNKPDIGIIGGHYGLGDSPGWVEKTWQNLKKDFSGDVSFVSAGNMVIYKKLFHQIGGFDECIETGEDWDICQRVKGEGYRVVNAPSLYVSHLGNIKSLIGFIKKERWYGRGMFDSLKGRLISKPLIASLIFILNSFFMVFSIVTTNLNLFLFSVLVLLILLILMSYSFTRQVKVNRLIMLLKCIPLSFSYVIGRSLSIFDLLQERFRSKFIP